MMFTAITSAVAAANAVPISSAYDTADVKKSAIAERIDGSS